VLIAANTKRTQLKPFSIAGTACLSAAAFLAIKDCLAADGVDVSNIAPSTPLHEYTRKNWQLFVHRIARLAPGAMPPIGISSPAYETNSAIGCLGGTMLLLGIFATIISVNAFPVLIIDAFILVATTVASHVLQNVPPASVTFGNLKTFRDLATCIASHTGEAMMFP